MIEIEDSVLEKLKCVVCDGYLSCSPVFLKHNGGSVCGRCPGSKDHATRNEPYEELAMMLAFPCRYRLEGCEKKISFMELKQHENECEYRPLFCPVVPSGNCEWMGPAKNLLQHCNAQHTQLVIHNPCRLEYDFTKNSLHSYLLTVFHALFLLQIKVCVLTSKIYHSVRLIGDPKSASQYGYDLEIKNGGILLRKQGVVEPQGCLTLQENSAIATCISGLCAIMEGYEGTTFKITLNKLLEVVNCVKCGEFVTKPAYRDTEGWRCVNCVPTVKLCSYSGAGCTFIDIEVKFTKHNRHYCTYTATCYICDMEITGLIEKHYRKDHSDVIHETGIAFSISNFDCRFVVMSDIGPLLCLFYNECTCRKLRVWSPLPSEQFSSYYIELQLIHPEKGRSFQYVLDVIYSDWSCDWCTDIERSVMDTVLVNGQCNVKIDLIQKLPSA